jgi:hypothetical protein
VTVYLACYRGSTRGPARIVGAVIRWVTRSEFSHCEIAKQVPLSGAPGQPSFECFSASALDGGVRSKCMPLPAERWHLTPLPSEVAERARELHKAQEAAAYDWWGVARFGAAVLFRKEHPQRWFCSEFCAAAMGLPDPWRWTPADLKIIAELLAQR